MARGRRPSPRSADVWIVGHTVVITGTNLIARTSAPEVRFSPYATDRIADHRSRCRSERHQSWSSPRVRGRTIRSRPTLARRCSRPYLVPPPDCAPVTQRQREGITFKLKRAVMPVDYSLDRTPLSPCVAAPRQDQRKKNGLKNVANATTGDTGPTVRRPRASPASTGPLPRRLAWGTLLPTSV
jgi:hypothetical protein